MANIQAVKQRRIKGQWVKLSLVRDAGRIPPAFSKINSSGDVFRILHPYYENHDREEFVMLCLDSKNKILALNSVSIGSLTASTEIHIRELFKAAILSNSASIIVSHNHPSGDPTPSDQDKKLTRRISAAGRLLRISVLDHIVVGHPRYFSFLDAGLL